MASGETAATFYLPRWGGRAEGAGGVTAETQNKKAARKRPFDCLIFHRICRRY